MTDEKKTKGQLIEELAAMRQRLVELEQKDDTYLFSVLSAIEYIISSSTVFCGCQFEPAIDVEISIL